MRERIHHKMRYLVKARVKPGREPALRDAIADGSLGRGSIAGSEYQENMRTARLDKAGVVQWVETCFCATPLAEERPYWEEFFYRLDVKDAHSRRNCRHENGMEPWSPGALGVLRLRLHPKTGAQTGWLW